MPEETADVIQRLIALAPRLETILPRLEKVVASQEISIENRKAHPDEYHLLRTAKMRALVCNNLIVTYATTAQDPWLKMPYKPDHGGGLNSRVQYHRMLDQNLLAGVPKGVWHSDEDGKVIPGSRFRLLRIPDDTAKGYLTLERFLHCAIIKICRRKRIDWSPWLRFYEAVETCEWCRPPM